MFDINVWEIIAIVVLALLIFGPDKLPGLAADAVRLLREVRKMASGARQDLKNSLGPELGDLNIKELDPRTFVKRNLFDPIDDEVQDVRNAANGSEGADGKPPARPTFDSDTT
ncbi:MAG: Sec-independent protein translocase subunit TatB [Actinomycetia bacterium]|nr:Sec-independent protein translocase subunit TatB [Actinomycetes bacterium]